MSTPLVVDLPADLVAWVEETAGGTLVGASRQQGGARKEAWFVDLAVDGVTEPFFLRFDRTAPTGKDPWTMHREAGVFLALQGSDVPVPKVLGVHPVHQAMLSERMSGQNWFSHIREPERQRAIAGHFMECLAALHRLDVTTLELPGLAAPAPVPDLVRHQLAELRSILAARGGVPDPALVFVLDWLERNIPAYAGPAVLVQGDTGPGNFMYEGDRVVAVVDWELAHLGDPMDDLAWLSLRAVQEPLPDMPGLIRRYEELSGHPVDHDRIAYYRVMAETLLQVMSYDADGALKRAEIYDGNAADIGNLLIYGQLHRRLWFEALGAATGLPEPTVELAPPVEPGRYEALSDVVLDHLRAIIVPRISDGFASARAKGLARVIKHLAALHAHGATYEAAEVADISATLGYPSANLPEARAALAEAVRTGTITDTQNLEILWRRAIRDNELLRDSSGALADRHWPAMR